MAIVELLIASRVDLNLRDKEGNIALIQAILKQHKLVIKNLLKERVDINIKDY